MKYLHTMVRVTDLDASLRFYCNALGLRELSRKMSDTALCKLERMAPNPIATTLDRFGDEYRAHAERGECLSGFHPRIDVPPVLEPLPGIEPASLE